MQSKAETVDDYLAKLPAERKVALDHLRALIREVAPTAVECMRSGIPSYEVGDLLCALASQKNYMAFYLLDTKLVDRFRLQLRKLNVGKGCIRFRRLEDLPLTVVRSMLVEAVRRRQAGITSKACDQGDEIS